MSNIKSDSLNRRTILKGMAAGGAIAGASSTSAVAALFDGPGHLTSEPDSYWNKARTSQHLCKQIHYAKSQELTRQLLDEGIDNYTKNMAIRTSNCPCCGTVISAQPNFETVAA